MVYTEVCVCTRVCIEREIEREIDKSNGLKCKQLVNLGKEYMAILHRKN